VGYKKTNKFQTNNF